MSRGQDMARAAARLLAGSWRADAQAPEVTASELASRSSLLAVSGAAPLAWWLVRGTPLAEPVYLFPEPATKRSR